MILLKEHALLKRFMLTIQNSAIALMNIINPNLDVNLVWSIAQHVQILFPALKQNLIEIFLMVNFLFLQTITAIGTYSLTILTRIEGSCDPGYFDDERSCIAGSFVIPYRSNSVLIPNYWDTVAKLDKTTLLWDSTYSSFFLSFSVNSLTNIAKEGYYCIALAKDEGKSDTFNILLLSSSLNTIF